MSDSHEPPPPLGSWPRLYMLVIAVALALLLLSYWFTATYQMRLEGG